LHNKYKKRQKNFKI